MANNVHYYAPALERMSRDEILGLQFKKLKYQLNYVYHHNPFYRRKFDEAQLNPDGINSLKNFKRFPFTVKADLLKDQEENPPFGSRLGVPEEKIALIANTAGTSGLGIELHAFTLRDLHSGVSACGFGFYWSGLRRGDVAVFSVAVSNHILGRLLLEGVQVLGRPSYLVGHLSFIDRLTHMKEFGVHGMWLTPSALNGLTTLCQQNDIDPREAFPDLKFILLAGEPHPLTWAVKMENIWGAKVFENYGSTQTGAWSSSTCERGVAVNEQRGMQHFYEWSCLHEVIDPETGEGVAPGESGELIVTPLEKEASPLIRFRTGDRVTYLPYTYCGCGRQLDGIEVGTITRLDDMLKVKGTNLWPSQVDSVIFFHEEVDEYQGQVIIGAKGRDEIEITIALKEKYNDLPETARAELVAKISAELKQKTELTMKVKEVERSLLPIWGTPERKARRWTDKRLKQMA
ncbi:MAG: AMP-binding protein [Pseudomonadota bacterium]